METLNPDFLTNALSFKHTTYRIDKHGQRHYLRVYDDGLTILAPSFHTVLNKVAPKSPYLIKWYKENTLEEINFVMENSRNYGTFFHVSCAEILQKEIKFSFNPDWIEAKMEKFFRMNSLDIDSCRKWMKREKRDIRLDLLCFALFCKEHEVEPISIEYPVMDQFGLVATVIDIVCKMKYKAKKCKRCIKCKEKYCKERQITALIDLKSGESVRDDYDLQLYVGERLWLQDYPEIKIDKLFNYNTNSFLMKTLVKYINGGKSGNFKPYTLTDQTKSQNFSKWKKYMHLYHTNSDNLKNIGVSLDINERFELDLDADFKDSIVVTDEIVELSEKDLF
jgi:hypothetical protein